MIRLELRGKQVLGAVVLAATALWPSVTLAHWIETAWLPESTIVNRDAEFVVEFWVAPTKVPFNAFDVTFSYDPAMLTFLQAVPVSAQQGSYMTSACGNTFHVFRAAGDSLAASVSLLCSGLSLTGPGQLYRLRFRAANVSAVTHVRVRRLEFYDAGAFARPSFGHDAVVLIDPVLGAPPSPTATGERVVAGPNPSRGSVQFTVPPSGGAPWRHAVVVDGQGRVVRVLPIENGDSHRVRWNGRDSNGRVVPPGTYWVEFRSAEGRAGGRLTRLR